MTILTATSKRILGMGVIISALIVLLVSGGALAKLPEPDNVVYGVIRADTVTVSLQVRGQSIASYTKGENPAAGDFYVLRVPMDALEPAEPGTARPGEPAKLFVNGQPVALVALGERGTIHRVDLSMTDLDGDGLSDDWEQQIVDANSSDAVASIADVRPWDDYDGDGFCNLREYLSGANPLNALEAPEVSIIYVDDNNVSGIEDGTETYPFNTVQEGVDFAGSGDTVRVLEGYYAENISLSKGISLIGDGSEATIIDGIGQNLPVISCSGFDGGLIQGFRMINGTWAGIECNDAALSIWGNDIADTKAGDGITVGPGSSASILNNIVQLNEQTGIRFEGVTALVLNNTIVGNGEDGVRCHTGSGLEITNNIVAGNGGFGIFAVNVSNPSLFYNNVWDNGGGSYWNCTAGKGDMQEDPKFVDAPNGDYRLSRGSPCIDAGDPVEFLTANYTGGLLLRVDSVTNVFAGDMIWVTDGINTESAEVTSISETTIGIKTALVNSYLISKGAHVFTESSDFSKEPEPNGARINVGAYGGTEEAEPSQETVYTDGKIKADFNGDGNADILLRNMTTGEIRIWLMDGTTRTSLGSPGTPDLVWQIEGLADFNADGNADILLRNMKTGEIQIWLIDGTTWGSPGTPDLAWQIEGLADFNADGKSDVLLRRHDTGEIQIWLMDGTTRTSLGSPGSPALAWQIEGIVDFNADGKSDVLLRRHDTGEIQIWLMDGTTRTSLGSPGAPALVWKIEGVADFNADGKSDIVLRRQDTGEIRIWLIDGTTRTSLGSPGSPALVWKIEGVADFNADGKSDIVLRRQDTGEIRVWLMNGATRKSWGSPGAPGLVWEIQ
jgi:hypothetical protein